MSYDGKHATKSASVRPFSVLFILLFAIQNVESSWYLQLTCSILLNLSRRNEQTIMIVILHFQCPVHSQTILACDSVPEGSIAMIYICILFGTRMFPSAKLLRLPNLIDLKAFFQSQDAEIPPNAMIMASSRIIFTHFLSCRGHPTIEVYWNLWDWTFLMNIVMYMLLTTIIYYYYWTHCAKWRCSFGCSVSACASTACGCLITHLAGGWGFPFALGKPSNRVSQPSEAGF